MIQTLISGAVTVMDPNVEHRIEGVPAVFQITPTVSGTINTIPDGLANQFYVLLVKTSGVTSFTLTFGNNFIVQATTLATGITAAKTFSMIFVSDGVNLVELSRTTAM